MVTAIAVVVVALAVNLKSTTTASLLGLSLNSVLGFIKSISTFVTFWTSLETSIGAVARVKTFAQATASEELSTAEVCEPLEWSARDSIEVNYVSASYGTNVQALSGINISIAPGLRIGICGRSGR